jgi:hypothetical protein
MLKKYHVLVEEDLADPDEVLITDRFGRIGTEPVCTRNGRLA